MSKRKQHITKHKINIKEEHLNQGIALINAHPLFGNLAGSLQIRDQRLLGKSSAALTDSRNTVILNKDLLLSPKEWAYIIAHCRLHLAFGHFDADKVPGYTNTDPDGKTIHQPYFHKLTWNMACDIYIAKFLADIKFGEPVCPDPAAHFPISLNDERGIYDYLAGHQHLTANNSYGTASPAGPDMTGLEHPLTYRTGESNRSIAQFARALSYSAANAVRTAGGQKILDFNAKSTPALQAAHWFINHYPLLGALAAGFTIIDDAVACSRYDIQIAAVDVTAAEIYVNPAAPLNRDELRFVLAHEFLHAGLQHHERRCGRDPYLWNIACDYVINGWLRDMQIGILPAIGLLYDETLKGMSAESIYDIIINDLKAYRRQNTFRGYGLGDIIESGHKKTTSADTEYRGMSLDDFYKNALAQGLEYHTTAGRGYIPAGLVEEIRALAMPPIPWDVQLARWFDTYFPPVEKTRSYARPSRRQAATPDIPRPRHVLNERLYDSRTFGVIIDTSGSMSARQIGQALGSIASYAAAKEVSFARVVFCDADAYDAGYLSVDEIAGRVLVKGRGGTRLQPAVALLEQAGDFPAKGPVLIITDGGIENDLAVHGPHAYLLPAGSRLPFKAGGEVFYFTE